MSINNGMTQPAEAEQLRRQAEERLHATTAGFHPPRNGDDMLRLVHELEVHQIELEMQNDELHLIKTELEKSLDRYTDLYDFAPVGYCSIDRAGTLHAANLTAEALLGRERSTLLGLRFAQFVATETRPLFAAFLDKVFAKQGRETCEVKLETAGDAPRFVRLEAQLCTTGQEARCVLIDVSGRRRVEEEFHKTRMRLSWVLEKTRIGMWLNELPLGRLTWDAQTRWLFYLPTGVEATIELFWSRIHPEDREKTLQAVEKSIRDHTLYEIEHRVVDPDSGKIRWIFSAGQATYAADGTPSHFDGINYDITESKLLKEKLLKSHVDLEIRVAERTTELTREIEERIRTEASLKTCFTEIKSLKDQLQAENIYLDQEIARRYNFGEIVGESKALAHVFSQVEQVSPMNATVLLLGETGTGKGVVARAIHSRSARKNRPMITVNCSTLPATLVESELFGRERGAFTGAGERQIGRFELADGGTIFLDEIGEMPLELQCKLLRVIQDGEFERLGNPRTIKTDVRIIAATNRNLSDGLKNGTFREDLFYRLNVFPILMPPLRQRREDIPLLINHFVNKFNHKIGRKITTVPKDTLITLQEYSWPGNVRELESIIQRAVIISQGSTLQVLDRFDLSRKPVDEPTGKDSRALIELEHDHVLKVLQQTGWRIEGKNGAAVILGLNASTLRARMRKYGITRD